MPEEETGQTPLFVPVGNARGLDLVLVVPLPYQLQT